MDKFLASKGLHIDFSRLLNKIEEKIDEIANRDNKKQKETARKAFSTWKKNVPNRSSNILLTIDQLIEKIVSGKRLSDTEKNKSLLL